MADIKTAVVRYTLPQVTGNFTVSIPGATWTPKALLVFAGGWAGLTDESYFTVGMCDGTNQRSLHCTSSDNLTTTQTRRAASKTDVLKIYSPNDYAADLLIQIDAVGTGLGPGSGQWVFNVAAENTAVERDVIFVFFGGNDLQAAVESFEPNATQNGTATETVGFDPDLVFFATAGYGGEITPSEDKADNSVMSLGAVHNNGGTPVQSMMTYGNADAVGTSVVTSSIFNNRAIGQTFNDVLNWTGEITSFPTNGFTMTTRDGASGADWVYYLALNVGDGDVSVNTWTWPDSTEDSVDYSITGVGFTPDVAVTITPLVSDISSFNTAYGSDATISVSAFDTDGRAGTVGLASDDGVGTSDEKTFESDKPIYTVRGDGTAVVTADSFTFNSDGVTFPAADLTSTGANGTYAWGFFVGDGVSVSSPGDTVIPQKTSTNLRFKPDRPIIIPDVPADTILWPMQAYLNRFYGQYRGYRISPTATPGWEFGLTGYGPSAVNTDDDGTDALIFDPATWTQSGVTDLTVVSICMPGRNHSAGAGTDADALIGWCNGSSNSQGFRMFLYNGGEARIRMPEAAGNVDTSGIDYSEDDLLVLIGRLGGGSQDLTVFNLTTGVTHTASSATSASITLPNIEIVLGNTDNANPKNNSFVGNMLGTSVTIGRRWTDAEVNELITNPFWWNKPEVEAPLLLSSEITTTSDLVIGPSFITQYPTELDLTNPMSKDLVTSLDFSSASPTFVRDLANRLPNDYTYASVDGNTTVERRGDALYMTSTGYLEGSFYIDLGRHYFVDELTLAIHLRVPEWASSATSGNGENWFDRLIAVSPTTSDTAGALAMSRDTTKLATYYGTATGILGDASTATYDSSVSISPDSEYHIIIMRVSGNRNETQIWVDGRPQLSTPFTHSSPDSGLHNIRLFNDTNFGSQSRQPTIYCKRVHIWQRALEDIEVQELSYNMLAPLKTRTTSTFINHQPTTPPDLVIPPPPDDTIPWSTTPTNSSMPAILAPTTVTLDRGYNSINSSGSSVATIQPTTDGLAWDLGDNKRLNVLNYPVPDEALDGYSIFVRARIDSMENFGGVFSFSNADGSANRLSLQRYSTTNDLIVYHPNDGGIQLSGGVSTIANGEWAWIALTWDGSTVYVYHDGTLIDSAAYSGVPVPQSDDRLVIFGERQDSDSLEVNGDFRALYMLSRHVTAEEVWARSQGESQWDWIQLDKTFTILSGPATTTPDLVIPRLPSITTPSDFPVPDWSSPLLKHCTSIVTLVGPTPIRYDRGHTSPTPRASGSPLAFPNIDDTQGDVTLEANAGIQQLSRRFSGDATNDRVGLGDITSDDPWSFFGQTEMSVISSLTYEGNEASIFPRIVDKSDASAVQNGWGMWINPDTNFVTFRIDSTGGVFQRSYDLPIGPHLIGVSMTGIPLSLTASPTGNWYDNGENLGAGSVTAAMPPFPSTTTKAAIGNWNHDIDRMWSGFIDFVAIFDKALTDAEHKAWYDDRWGWIQQNEVPIIIETSTTPQVIQYKITMII